MMMPKTVNGKTLTAKRLKRLVAKYGIKCSVHDKTMLKGLKNQTPKESHWVLVTNEVIPNSTNLPYTNQVELLKPPYEISRVMDVMVAVFMQSIHKNKQLYGVYQEAGPHGSKNIPVYARCVERVERKYHMTVGSFTDKRLNLNSQCNEGIPGIGVSAVIYF